MEKQELHTPTRSAADPHPVLNAPNPTSIPLKLSFAGPIRDTLGISAAR